MNSVKAQSARSANPAVRSRKPDEPCGRIPVDRLVGEVGRIEERVMSGSLGYEGALQALTDVICTVAGVSACAVGTLAGSHLSWSATSGAVPPNRALTGDSPFILEPLNSGRFTRCEDVLSDNRIDSALLKQMRFRSAGVWPLWSSGSHFGVLAVFSEEPRTFGDTHIMALATCATVASSLAAELKPAEPEPDPSTPAAASTKVEPIEAVPSSPALSATAEDFDLLSILQPQSARVQTEPEQPPPVTGVPISVVPTPTRHFIQLGVVVFLVLSLSTLVFSRVLASRKAVAFVQQAARLKGTPVVTHQEGLAQHYASGSRASAITPGQLRSAPLPVYPPAAIRDGLQGEVTAILRVNQSGVVDGVEITHGDAAFSSTAALALAHWHFSPFYAAGKPVAVNLPVTLNFRISAQ